MSDRDSFIDEVSEEVRRDRMYALWRRYGGFVIGAIVAVVAAAGVKTWLDAEAKDEARRAGGAVIAAARGEPAAAAEALAALAEGSDNEGARLLARLRAAAALAETGETDAAAAAYDAVAADGAADPVLQDFAAYRAVALRAPAMAPEEAVAAFAPIAEGAGPFRLLGQEGQAGAWVRAGERDKAVEALRRIAETDEAPNGLKQRAVATLTALGAPLEDDASAGDGEAGDADGEG